MTNPPRSQTNWQIPRELPDLRRVGIVALDTETHDEGLRDERGSSWPWGGGYVCGISLASREGGEIRSLYVPMQHPNTQNFDPAAVYRWLKDLVASGVRFVTLNGIYDWGWLRTDGGILMPRSDHLEEVGALATIVDENQRRYSLDALCERYGLPGKDMAVLNEAVEALGLSSGRKKIDAREHIWRLPAHLVGPYAEGDAVKTLLLFEGLDPVLDQEGTRDAYRLEVDLMPVVMEMRRRGIRIDQGAAEQARDLLLGKRDAALTQLSKELGKTVSMTEPNRPKWKADTFDRYGIGYQRTAKGNPSFAGGGGKSGWMIKHELWLPRLISTASKYDSAACKVLEGYILEHIVNGRIHAELHPFKSEDSGARSFRFSISSPPLQQMPSRDPEIGPLIRSVFLPEEGEWWASSDASQQEFRILTHYGVKHGLTGAREAAEVYRNDPDADFHATVAEMTGLDRTTAKAINFGKIYGAGVPKLAGMMGKSQSEAQAMVAQYDGKLPFVSKLSRIVKSMAERNGFTELYNGARRHWDQYEVPFIHGKDAGPCGIEQARLRVADPEHRWYCQQLRRANTYTALNALVQGSAAIHTKLWLLACWREGIVPMLQMHDALECSVRTAEQGEMVARLGCEAVSLAVPMRVDLKFGKSWGDAKHSSEELTGAPHNGATQHSETLASQPAIELPSDPATVLPASQPSGATTQIDPPDSNEQSVPPHCLGGDTEPDGQPRAPGKSNGHDQRTPPEPTTETAIEVHKVWVTRFPDKFAASLKHGYLTLPEIASSVAVATAATKEQLPLLKLQRYGGVFSVNNCLRYDDNVLEISGLEGEHDKGTLSFADAVAAIRKVGIRCVVYTSPSYIPGEKERWRVLVPLSQFRAPSFRVGLIAGLNGILGGALAAESFTLSQPFYYGSVNNNPNHRVELIDGDFLDLRNDLAAGAIFKDGSRAGDHTPGSHAKSQATGERTASEPWEDLVVKILLGEPLHPSLLVLAAKMVAAGMSGAAVENFLRGLMEKSAAARDKRWQERYDDIPRLVGSAEQFRPPPPIDTTMLFAHLRGHNGPSTGTGAGNSNTSEGGIGTGSTRKLSWLDMSNWDHEPIPERKWAIPDCVPLNQVGLFSGEGGTGKSIVEIMKNVAHVADKDWLGLLPEQGGAFYLGAEDETDELHIRLAVIARHYGVSFKELIAGGLQVLPLLGEDAVLCAVNPRSGRVEPTALYWQIHEQAGDLKPKNISVDTLSRAFAGNEIDRSQVYGFAMHMQAIAKAASGSVTVLSHPSLAGMASGSGISGSTAWHGAFRFRQYLKGVKAPGAEEISPERPEPDNGLRLLEFKKNQYGPLGASIALRYENGLFLPELGATDAEKLARQEQVQQVFMQLLERFNGQGRNASHARNSNNYAPVTFAKETEAIKHGLRKADFEGAMRDLFAAGRIKVETYGRPSRPFQRLTAV